MSKSIICTKHGGVDSFKLKKLNEQPLLPHEALLRQSAIGINYFDILHRKGFYKLDKFPAILGFEAVGTIAKLGSEVPSAYKIGERVGYGMAPLGAYATQRAIHTDFLVAIPDEIDDVVAAALLAKGMATHSLLHRVTVAQRAKYILVTAAAGGVGSLICQWASYLGIKVIGAVGSANKINIASGNGCFKVVNYGVSPATPAKKGGEDYIKEIVDATGGKGVDIVFDGVGGAIMPQLMWAMAYFGTYVSYGEAGGKASPLDLDRLAGRGLFITRPALSLYKSQRMEMVLSAAEVFAQYKKGVLKPHINRYGFESVARAHRDIEARVTNGSSVLTT